MNRFGGKLKNAPCELKASIFSAALLAGTITGAGVFSFPYIFAQVGIFNGILYLLIFTLVYFAIHLMYADLVQAQPGNNQFLDLAKTYLPSFLAQPAGLVILGELILVLTGYLILAPVFGQLIFHLPSIIFLIAFWLLGSFFILVRVSQLGLIELLGLISIFLILIVLILSGLDKTLETPWFKSFNWSTFFLPFGPMLFALAGRPAINKVVELFRQSSDQSRSSSLTKVIFLGTITPALVYLIFVFSVLRLNSNIPPEAFSGLNFLPPFVSVALGIMGLITIWTSYFIIGINLKEILRFDLNFSQFGSTLLVFFLPLVFYFSGLKNFLSVISLTGGLFLSLEAIFIVMMWHRAFPNNFWQWLRWPLYLIFMVAIFYQVFSFFVH